MTPRHRRQAGILPRLSKPVPHLRCPCGPSSGCWLLRREDSCNVLDGLGQQQVPGRRGMNVAGPVGKLDKQSRRAWIAVEMLRRAFESGETVSDLPAEGRSDRRDHRVE
jgi:hypothetical protein